MQLRRECLPGRYLGRHQILPCAIDSEFDSLFAFSTEHSFTIVNMISLYIQIGPNSERRDPSFATGGGSL